MKQRIRSLLDLAPGQRVLDVGCGPGLDTAAAAECVGPAGRVAGIDYDPSMIRDARAMDDRGTGRNPRVWYQVADAAHIPYRTGALIGAAANVCYSIRTDAAAVVREMGRVTKPGGVIVVADTDWATLESTLPNRPWSVRWSGSSATRCETASPAGNCGDS